MSLATLALGDYSQVGLSNKPFRHAWIKKTLQNLPPGLSILDAGAGEMQFKPFCSHLKYTSQDFNEYTGTGDGKGIQTEKWDTSAIDIVSDITKIPREDNSFDVILCTEVLEHVPDPNTAIREMIRLLKPKGKLIITAPFCSITHFAPYHFCSGFNQYYYRHNLSELGLDITEMTINGNYFEYLGQETRYVKEVAEKYAGLKMNFFEKVAQRIFLAFLQKASARDTNSNELLFFGAMIVAQKK